jgi:hypothetical protein
MMMRLVHRAWLTCAIVVTACSDSSDVSVDSVDRALSSGGGDIVLERALRPVSGERIDCGGRTIRGAPVLLYLLDVENVTVQNCVFKDADIAVLAMRGGGHHFSSNRFENLGDTAIWVVGSSANDLRENVVQVGSSTGFMFNGNADHNRVHHNVIHAGLGVGSYWSPHSAVINVVVDGELQQILNETDMLDDLRIWNNDIEISADGEIGIGLMGRTRDGRAWNNTVRGGWLGVGSWGYWGEPVVLPGTCSRDATRRCTPEAILDKNESDCFVDGVDAKSKGTCVGWQNVAGETRVIRSTFTDNVISGTAGPGVEIFLAPSTRVEGNDISSCAYGIHIGDFMLQSGTIVGNVVHGNQVGLAIDNALATRAGAKIAFNDFVDNVEPDHTQQWVPPEHGDDWTADCSDGCVPTAYELATDLSLNYWGLTCAQGGAPTFNDADLTASPAFGAPVAHVYREKVKAGGAVDLAALPRLCD